jgi:hypothetical protein
MDEFPMLDESILRLVMLACANLESNWNSEQIRLIAGDLWYESNIQADTWNDATILDRIDIMLMKGVDPNDINACASAERALLFRSACECTHPPVIDRVISADDLMEFIEPLHALKTFQRWKISDVTALAHALSGIATIDCGVSIIFNLIRY